jgi:hypothetical protein
MTTTKEPTMKTMTSVRAAVVSLAIVGFALSVTTSLHAQTATQPKASKPAGLDDIMLMQPMALKAGDNQFEVMLKGPDNKPVTGADVSLQFVMPKTATMAEMRNEVKLKPSPATAGLYTGPGMVMMAGTWNTTVMVMEDGKALGQKKVTLMAK